VFLNDPKQLCLQGQWQFTDLVEKQGTAVCQGEGPIAFGHGTRESSALMSKELAAGQFRNDSGTI